MAKEQNKMHLRCDGALQHPQTDVFFNICAEHPDILKRMYEIEMEEAKQIANPKESAKIQEKIKEHYAILGEWSDMYGSVR